MKDRGGKGNRIDPIDQARRPLGVDGIEQRRSQGVVRLREAIHGYDQAVRARRPPGGLDDSTEEISARLDRMRRPERKGGRSRFVAVVVLIMAAVIVGIGGVLASSGVAGSGVSVSVSILPFPENTDTTVPQ